MVDPAPAPIPPAHAPVESVRAPQLGVVERPPHLRAGAIGLVFVGGAIGTGARATIAALVPHVDGIPIGTFAVNIFGAFLLGTLVALLGASDANARRTRTIRVFFATGVLGGFTTYSSLAVETLGLLENDQWVHALVYGLVTVVTGAAAAWGGMLLGARPWSRRQR